MDLNFKTIKASADPAVATTGQQLEEAFNQNFGSVGNILAELDDSKAAASHSHSYSDLTGKPAIPAVNNPTITLRQGGVAKGSFGLNQATTQTIDLDADGDGDSDHRHNGTDSPKIAYSDLTGAPVIPVVRNPIITLRQGGSVKGSFSLNQATAQTIDIDAGGTGTGGVTQTAGTFSPAFYNGSTDVSGQFEVSTARYIRTGDLIHVSMYFRKTTGGAASYSLQIRNLPFAPDANDEWLLMLSNASQPASPLMMSVGGTAAETATAVNFTQNTIWCVAGDYFTNQ